MTPIIHFNGPSSETEPVPLCRRRAMECQRTALTTTNPKVRLRYLHLAKLWKEMADDAERRTPSEAHGVVIFLGEFQKSK
jgi:hypothetical protein